MSKKASACFNEIIWLSVMKMKIIIKDKSHKFDIKGPRLRQRHKHAKYNPPR